MMLLLLATLAPRAHAAAPSNLPLPSVCLDEGVLLQTSFDVVWLERRGRTRTLPHVDLAVSLAQDERAQLWTWDGPSATVSRVTASGEVAPPVVLEAVPTRGVADFHWMAPGVPLIVAHHFGGFFVNRDPATLVGMDPTVSPEGWIPQIVISEHEGTVQILTRQGAGSLSWQCGLDGCEGVFEVQLERAGFDFWWQGATPRGEHLYAWAIVTPVGRDAQAGEVLLLELTNGTVTRSRTLAYGQVAAAYSAGTDFLVMSPDGREVQARPAGRADAVARAIWTAPRGWRLVSLCEAREAPIGVIRRGTRFRLVDLPAPSP